MRTDDAAFLQVTLPAIDRLWSLARRCTSSKEEAEDLVQETYLRALDAWRRHRHPERVEAWLATICLNVVRSDYRRRRRRVQEVLMADPGRAASGTADPAAEALGVLDREAVHRALAALPEDQRIAVTLVDICGLTAAEASRAMGSPRGTVLSWVHRGRKALAARVAGTVRHAP
ncbi:MAG TPA: RNA polymerase sigma factor [Actinomycetota bacterium]|jgi:RNA polymerase sigma-70 factor (ECF subfamily)